MLAVFLLCAAFALSGATDPVEELVAVQQNEPLEPHVEPSAEQHPLLDEFVPALDSAEEMEALQQNMSIGNKEKVERRSLLGYGVENRSPCPSGWSPYGSRCFTCISNPSTWADAELYCLRFGANLVSIHSSQENYFVQELVRKNIGGFPRTWIGASDTAVNNLWFWSDGSRFDFQAWARGEPSNYQGRESCVEINFGGDVRWNDANCGYRLPFVCAKRLNC